MSSIKPDLIFYCVGAYLVGMLLGSTGLLPRAPSRDMLPVRHGQVLQVQVASNQLPAATARQLP